MSIFLLSQWIVILIVSLYAVYKGTDIVLQGFTQTDKSLGVPSHYYGAVLVGMVSALPVFVLTGTSVFFGHSAMAVPTVMGSVITTLLVGGGLLAFVGGSIVLWEDFFKTTLPVFCLSVAFFVLAILDGVFDRLEVMLLIGTFLIFVLYIYQGIQSENFHTKLNLARASFSLTTLTYGMFGVVAIIVGARFSIVMAATLGDYLAVSLPLLSMSVLAIGVSLPTLVLVLQALQRKDITFALGIIIGSCIFSLLIASGVAVLWTGTLVMSEMVMKLAVPVLIVSTIIIIATALSRNFVRPVGMMLLLFFMFYLLKLGVFIN